MVPSVVSSLSSTARKAVSDEASPNLRARDLTESLISLARSPPLLVTRNSSSSSLMICKSMDHSSVGLQDDGIRERTCFAARTCSSFPLEWPEIGAEHATVPVPQLASNLTSVSGTWRRLVSLIHGAVAILSGTSPVPSIGGHLFKRANRASFWP